MMFMVTIRTKVWPKHRDNMINVQDGLAIVRATRSKIFTGLRSDYTEKMRFPPKPGHGYTDHGWWSGFLSSKGMHRLVIRMNRIKR